MSQRSSDIVCTRCADVTRRRRHPSRASCQVWNSSFAYCGFGPRCVQGLEETVVNMQQPWEAARPSNRCRSPLTPAVPVCVSGAEAGAPQPPGEGGRPAAHRGADPAAAQHTVRGAASLRAGCGGEEHGRLHFSITHPTFKIPFRILFLRKSISCRAPWCYELSKNQRWE